MICWHPQMDQILRELYPDHGSRKVMEKLQETLSAFVTQQQINDRARHIGVRSNYNKKTRTKRQDSVDSEAMIARDNWHRLMMCMPALRR